MRGIEDRGARAAAARPCSPLAALTLGVGLLLSARAAAQEGYVLVQAVKSYEPSRWDDGVVSRDVPFDMPVPSSLPVVEGNAGNHTARLRFRASASEPWTECRYRGGADEAHPVGAEQLAHGMRYVLESCTRGVSGGDVIRARQVRLHIDNGVSDLPEDAPRTRVQVLLGTPRWTRDTDGTSDPSALCDASSLSAPLTSDSLEGGETLRCDAPRWIGPTTLFVHEQREESLSDDCALQATTGRLLLRGSSPLVATSWCFDVIETQEGEGEHVEGSCRYRTHEEVETLRVDAQCDGSIDLTVPLLHRVDWFDGEPTGEWDSETECPSSSSREYGAIQLAHLRASMSGYQTFERVCE